METKYMNYYAEDKPFDVNLDAYLKRIFSGVESFLTKVQTHDQEAFQGVVTDLHKRVESKDIEISHTRISSINETDYPLITKYPELKTQIINYVLGPLETHQTITHETQTITCTVKAWLQSRLFQSYQMAKSLTSIMTKEEAIHFFQEYIDEGTRKARDPANYRETLIDEQEATTFFETFAGHDLTLFTLNTRKAGQKIVKCKWHEVMKELQVPDFAYAVACHYDFEATKNVNPAFTLTRTKTLMEGDEYCDFCLHDTRKMGIEHPSEDFWKEL